VPTRRLRSSACRPIRRRVDAKRVLSRDPLGQDDAPLTRPFILRYTYRNPSTILSTSLVGALKAAINSRNTTLARSPGELREITAGGDLPEEFRCAQYLDQHPQIDYWARNLARKHKSFRFRTSTDWFYPDFIAQLTDGRVLAVEYKGTYLYDGIDAEEKRAVGAVWESRSNGQCLFVMPTAGELSEIARKIRG